MNISGTVQRSTIKKQVLEHWHRYTVKKKCIWQFMQFSLLRSHSRTFPSFYIYWHGRYVRNRQSKRRRTKKRKLHELPHTEMVKSGTVKLTIQYSVYNSVRNEPWCRSYRKQDTRFTIEFSV